MLQQALPYLGGFVEFDELLGCTGFSYIGKFWSLTQAPLLHLPHVITDVTACMPYLLFAKLKRDGHEQVTSKNHFVCDFSCFYMEHY